MPSKTLSFGDVTVLVGESVDTTIGEASRRRQRFIRGYGRKTSFLWAGRFPRRAPCCGRATVYRSNAMPSSSSQEEGLLVTSNIAFLRSESTVSELRCELLR